MVEQTATLNLDNVLWRWLCQSYERPGVAELCLDLQDTYELDVNFLLTGLYLGLCRQVVDAQEWDELLQVTATLRGEMVVPLRQLRQAWRGRGYQAQQGVAEVQALRSRVQTLELQAEQMVVAVLYQAFEPRLLDARPVTGSQSKAEAGDNLKAYVAAHQSETEIAVSMLHRLVALCE